MGMPKFCDPDAKRSHGRYETGGLRKVSAYVRRYETGLNGVAGLSNRPHTVSSQSTATNDALTPDVLANDALPRVLGLDRLSACGTEREREQVRELAVAVGAHHVPGQSTDRLKPFRTTERAGILKGQKPYKREGPTGKKPAKKGTRTVHWGCNGRAPRRVRLLDRPPSLYMFPLETKVSD